MQWLCSPDCIKLRCTRLSFPSCLREVMSEDLFNHLVRGQGQKLKTKAKVKSKIEFMMLCVYDFSRLRFEETTLVNKSCLFPPQGKGFFRRSFKFCVSHTLTDLLLLQLASFLLQQKNSPVLSFLCSIHWKTNKNKNRALRSCIFSFWRPCGREGKLQLC